MIDELICAHTDFRFKSLNKKRPKCPYCNAEMNHIARRIWQGPINKYFHAEVELVCNNPLCPFPNANSWKQAEQEKETLILDTE